VKLAELMAGAPVRAIDGDPEVEITGISYDSRETRPGDWFFALAREAARNRSNIDDALKRGARAVAVDGRWREKSEARLAVNVPAGALPAGTIVDAPRPRLLMGVAAARFFGAPSERVNVAGITGTSGKTTTTYLLRSIFEAAGRPTGIIGTIGIFVRDRKIYHGLTTPEPVDFEAGLAQMEREGVHDAFAEVSSIGIAEGRVDALNFRAGIFTNLGRDHLDYHGNLENYFAAKLRLFTEILPNSTHRDPIAVVNGDDPYGRRILAAIQIRKVGKLRKISFGLDHSLDVHPLHIETGIDGIHGTISVLGREIGIDSPLLGEFYLRNILGASALSVASGIDGSAVAEGVRRCSGAPGRMEAVPARGGVTVLVDYAHKPDALEAVLNTLRPLTRGRLLCVFGCGGDRDRGKRPVMGEIAGRLAGLAILTSDNPRTEDPLKIIAEVEAGLKSAGLRRIEEARANDVSGYIVEPDRRGAIAVALRLARPGDVVVIAGKGHEDYQLVGNKVLNFDDRAVVRELASELGF
jgi:UDP-N-acetylmuramoyl-L-alanyl-D-glutamate--2,6-diaminopimelate ligase